MAVKRIVANIAIPEPAKADSFYSELLQLDRVMDLGFIRTYASAVSRTAQISVASEGGSNTPVPDLSIEVDDLDEVIARFAAQDIAFEYGPVVEPWGVRRLYVRDPFGRLVNILTHDC